MPWSISRHCVRPIPANVDLLTKLGTCLYFLDRNREAVERFEEVIGKDPQAIIAYGTLARIFRDRLNDPEKADQIIDKMVEANPEDAKAQASVPGEVSARILSTAERTRCCQTG